MILQYYLIYIRQSKYDFIMSHYIIYLSRLCVHDMCEWIETDSVYTSSLYIQNQNDLL